MHDGVTARADAAVNATKGAPSLSSPLAPARSANYARRMPITSAELTRRLEIAALELRQLREAANQMAAIGDKLIAQRQAAKTKLPSDEANPDGQPR